MSGPPAPGPAARRRAVALALARRPGLDLAALGALLARLGLEVDRATLVGDLAALDVAVAPDGTLHGAGPGLAPGRTDGTPPPAPPSSSDLGSARPGQGATGADEATGAEGALPRSVEGHRSGRSAGASPGAARRGVGVVVALALATVVAVVIGVLVVGGDGPADDVALTPPAGVEDGAADPSGPDPGVAGLRIDPAAANLAVDGAVDSATLPVVEDLGEWVVGPGTWAVRGGRIEATPAGGAALAWLPTPGSLEAQVVAEGPATAGLAVHVAGPDRYVAWVREPSGDVALLQVEGGARQVVARVPQAARGREAEALGVRVTGGTVEGFVAGGFEASYALPLGADLSATSIGLVVLDAGPAAATVAFDDLLVRFTP